MEWINLLITFVLGGGLVALATVKPQAKKVKAEAKQTDASANTTEIENFSRIAKEWREYAQEAEMRYSTMTKLMQSQIESLSHDVSKLSRQLNQILKIIKDMNHENLEQKKQEAKDVAEKPS
jgi:esterase/lipase